MKSHEEASRGWVRAGAFRYEFDVRKRPGERARVVINCVSPTGNCCRMSVDEEDWPAFVAAFNVANESMTSRELLAV